MTDKIVVLVTCSSAKEARKIARALVEQRLAACGNVVHAPVHSIYRWKGRVESAKEFLLILKTSRRRWAAMKKAIKVLHSYEVPEVIALPIASGSREYLNWISECVASEETGPSGGVRQSSGISRQPSLEARPELEYNESVMHVEALRRKYCPVLGCVIVLAAVWFCAAGLFAQENNPNPSSAAPSAQGDQGSQDKKNGNSSDVPTTKLRIVVTDAHDKPVANASVYVRYTTSGGFMRHDKLAELNFKTSQEGSVKVPAIPQGKIMIQVIATGWHTFGKWYDIDKDEESVAIKLEPPPHWY